MNKFIFALAILTALTADLRAQVTAEIVMSQEYFLMGESIPVAVRITNRSGQKLSLGEDSDWLQISVEARGGIVVAKNSEPNIQGIFTIESGQVATRRLDIAPHFSFEKNGRYQIVATAKLKAWDTTISTKAKTFDIINGAKVWAQEFGMPKVSGEEAAPEVRRYSLEQANHLRSELKLYLRVTDASGSRVINVTPIGKVVAISKPQCEIDRRSNLHVLYQNGARAYLYTVLNPDGEILLRQTHEIADARPRLKGDQTGMFTVAGGLRLPSENDIPSPKPIEADAVAK
jgi:hypothetical protein